MPVCVTSEIGSLKRVLLQRPGRELEHLSPNTMEQLLFDDIPYLYGAQQEHDCFAEILRGCDYEADSEQYNYASNPLSVTHRGAHVNDR